MFWRKFRKKLRWKSKVEGALTRATSLFNEINLWLLFPCLRSFRCVSCQIIIISCFLILAPRMRMLIAWTGSLNVPILIIFNFGSGNLKFSSSTGITPTHYKIQIYFRAVLCYSSPGTIITADPSSSESIWKLNI